MPVVLLDEVVSNWALGMKQNNSVLLISKYLIADNLKLYFVTYSSLDHKNALLFRPLNQVELDSSEFTFCASKGDVGS